MKRLNTFIMVMLSTTALLMTSVVMAAGKDLSSKSKKDSFELTPLESMDSFDLGNSVQNVADPSDRHRHDHNRCEVRNRVGVPCSDGFCDVRAGGGGGRGEHNNDSKLCKGHGGVASPS